MAVYSLEEYYDFFLIYLENDEDPVQASINYRQRVPNRARFPDDRVFRRLGIRMRYSGRLVPEQNAGGRRREVPEELEELILDHFAADPHLTIRTAARRLHTTYHSVQSTLKIHGWHAYHEKFKI